MAISNSPPRPPYKALALCALAYALAFLAAIGVGYLFRRQHPVLMIFIADIAGTLVIYAFGRFFRNASFYDPYWSVAPLVIALFWILTASAGVPASRQVIVTVLVFAWGLRLTFNWTRGWRGLGHEDWRYRDFREKTGKWFWLVDLVGIELTPTLVVFLGCLPLYPALAAGNNSFNVLDILAIVITLGAIIIEAVADEQLRNFRRRVSRPGEIMTEGLWAYSRHPNYLGEVAFWWGLYFFGLAAGAVYWWTICGPVAVTLLFTFVSVPMMEKRNLARRHLYSEYRKKIPPLVPWFPRGL